MRDLILTVVAALTIFSIVAPPASAITMAEWATSPITVGDKVFTLISTDWAGTTNISAASSSETLYGWTLTPSEYLPAGVIKTVVYSVTIIDDPATPADETSLYDFDRVAMYEDHDLFGMVWYRGDFDNDSDFGSPLVTFVSGGDSGTYAASGAYQELYVRLRIEAVTDVLIDYATISFWQAEDPIPAEATSWGSMKSLYR
jgi:hypothetical protein